MQNIKTLMCKNSRYRLRQNGVPTAATAISGPAPDNILQNYLANNYTIPMSNLFNEQVRGIEFGWQLINLTLKRINARCIYYMLW